MQTEWTPSKKTSADRSWWREYETPTGKVTALILLYGATFYAQLRGKGGKQVRLGKYGDLGDAQRDTDRAMEVAAKCAAIYAGE